MKAQPLSARGSGCTAISSPNTIIWLNLLCSLQPNCYSFTITNGSNCIIYYRQDPIRSTHTDCGVVILDYFNNLYFCDLLSHHTLKQSLTLYFQHADNVLDLIVTNLGDFYCDPDVIASLGSSDHSIVKWTSGTNGYVRSDSKSTAKKRVSARQSRSQRARLVADQKCH